MIDMAAVVAANPSGTDRLLADLKKEGSGGRYHRTLRAALSLLTQRRNR